MRSNVVLVVILLLGCVMSFGASPALPPSLAPAPAPAPAPTPAASTTPFSISEYEVDRNGLWTDHEIPLSDASMEAIRQATPATPADIAAWNAEAEPGMQVQAVIEDDETAETEADTDTEAEPETEAEAESDEQDTAESQDDLEITHGQGGRMILIPHSRNLMMRRIIMYLTRLIAKLKARSSLARVELKLKIEPVTPTPTPTPTPTRPRITPAPRPRRPTPSLGVIHRPRPVALRLIPSRADLQTRRLLARCSMLLRMALKRFHDMRRKLIKAKMNKRRRSPILGLRFPGRGVILFRSNNITTAAPSFSRSSAFKFEIEAERNGTVTIIAPRVNANLTHSIIVINRGTIILLNRSNNTFATTIAPRPTVRRFPLIPARSHHIMTANENDIEHNVA